MLQMLKVGLFSTAYSFEKDGEEVATLQGALLSQQAEIRIGDRELHAMSPSWIRSRYQLREGDTILYEVSRASWFSRRYTFRHQEQAFNLRPVGFFASSLVVETGGSEIGVLEPVGVLWSGVKIDLRRGLPLDLQVFLGWVARALWSQDSQ
jgi:hypothetical protein